jgi:hypothetical protein
VQVAAFGKTTLGLTYSLVLGEAVLSPAIPSVAARAGGIFFPLAKVGQQGGGGGGGGGGGAGRYRPSPPPPGGSRVGNFYTLLFGKVL